MREIRTAALIGMGAMGAVFAPGLSATLGDLSLIHISEPTRPY